MAVVNTTNTIREAGNGVKVAFDVPFVFYNTTDLKVYKILNSTGARTLMSLGSDYTVAISASAEGGTVTYSVAPTSLQDSFIEREQPYTQSTNIPAVGGVREEQLEKGLDKLCILILQLFKKTQLALKFISSSSQSDVILPEPEAGKVLGWGQTVAANMENYTADSGVAAAEAEAAAAAAAASQAAAGASASSAGASATAAAASAVSAAAAVAPLVTQGGTLYRGASANEQLAPGTAGFFLKTLGAAANPAWAMPTEIVSGSYTGNGSSPRTITPGFTDVTKTPKFVMVVKGASSGSDAVAHCRIPGLSLGFAISDGTSQTNSIGALSANAFVVGSDVNAGATTYYWIAIG